MLQSIRVFRFVVFGLLTLASGVGAQVCSDPANLTTNCGFLTDNSGWTVTLPSGLGWNPAGNQEPGSALGIGGTGGMGYVFEMYQCIGSIAASTAYGFGAVVQEEVPGTLDGCTVYVEEFSDGSCTTPTGPGDLAFVISFAGWTDIINTTFTTSASTQSVRITVGCNRVAGPFNVLVDDIYFGIGLSVPVELTTFKVE